MKIVLDTNCLLPILVPGSFGHDIWRAFQRGKYTLCVSADILFEYEEILLRITGDKQFAADVIEAIENASNVEHVVPSFHFNLITADPDDNKFVDCAITAGATFIVSNDKHFSELKQIDFPKVDVCALADFLRIVRTMFY